MSERELTEEERRAVDALLDALAEAVLEPFVVAEEVFMARAAAPWRARIAELNAGPFDDRLKLLAELYQCDVDCVRDRVDAIEFSVGDDLNLAVNVRMRRSVEVVYVTATINDGGAS